MANINTAANIGFIGWKHYNQAIKKAMEQEFSWPGLLISLSIAFFIVLFSAIILNLAYQSIETAKNNQLLFNNKIYRLESYDEKLKINNYINTDYINRAQRTQLENALSYKIV